MGSEQNVEVFRRVLDAFNRHDPDAIMSHFACGNRGASAWTISGTTVGGEPIEVRGCDLWTLGGDGKTARKDSFWKIRAVD